MPDEVKRRELIEGEIRKLKRFFACPPQSFNEQSYQKLVDLTEGFSGRAINLVAQRVMRSLTTRESDLVEKVMLEPHDMENEIKSFSAKIVNSHKKTACSHPQLAKEVAQVKMVHSPFWSSSPQQTASEHNVQQEKKKQSYAH